MSVAAVSTALPGLGASWFFVGTSNPRLILKLEVVPRLGFSIVGSLLLWTSSNVIAFPLSQLVGELIILFRSHRRIAAAHPGSLGWDWTAKSTLNSLRQNLSGALTSFPAASYSQLPIIAVAALHPSMVADFAILDRVLKFSSRALTPITQVAQGWVPTSLGRTVQWAHITTAVKWSAQLPEQQPCASGSFSQQRCIPSQQGPPRSTVWSPSPSQRESRIHGAERRHGTRVSTSRSGLRR